MLGHPLLDHPSYVISNVLFITEQEGCELKSYTPPSEIN